MSTLAGELLHFARSRLEPRSTTPSAIPIARLVERIVNLEKQAGARVEIAVPPSLTVTADERDLERALGNVVRNAIRYAAHAGPIRVTAAPANGRIEIVVADSGPGVPPHA